MRKRLTLANNLQEVGAALREPEAFAIRWRDGGLNDVEPVSAVVFPLLTVTAVLCTAAYGITMGLHQGPEAMITKGMVAPFAAGLAWLITLPTLYIINSLSGSKLNLPTTTLAALITVNFGALAMLASIPINGFFTIAFGSPTLSLLVNYTVFAGVGISMLSVFMRVMKALEPRRNLALLWLILVAATGTELFHLFGLFRF